MATTRMQIQGLNEFVKKLKAIPKKVEDRLKLEILDSCTQIEIDAVAAAPIGVKQRIDKLISKNGLSGSVMVQGSVIYVYLEFGTGASAAEYVPTLPKEIQEAAMKFYINGEGKLKKHPYLIPAYLKEKPKFIEAIEKILKEELNA